MGKPAFQAESKVLLSNFEHVVKKAAEETKGSLTKAGISSHDIKTVFRAHQVEPETGGMASYGTSVTKEPFIPVRDFKDKFLPSLGYKKDANVDVKSQASKKGVSGGGSSATESMHIDNLMQGTKPGDQKTAKTAAKPGAKGAQMSKIKEDVSESGTQDSMISKPIDGMVGSKGLDPRKKQAQRQLAKISEQKGEGFLSKEALDLHN
jgi:hypothetical protein